MNILNFENKSVRLDTEEHENNPNITKIILSGNSLGVNAAEIISKSLIKQQNLKELILSDLFTGRLRSEIPKALEFICNGVNYSGSQITELDLSDNAFGPDGIRALKPFFEHESSESLQILKFNNNGMGIEGGKVLSLYLKACYKRCQMRGKQFGLREFYAGRNRLENKGAKALSEAFKDIGTLEVISIPQNGIYHDGISALSQAFSYNPGMKVINLNDNTATHLGAASLARALVTLFELESLNIGDCLLKDSGVFHLARAFNQMKFQNFKELILNNNEITIKGALEILDSLEDSNLVYLCLDGNFLGTSGINMANKRLKEMKRKDLICTLSEDEGTPDEVSDDEDQSPYEQLSAGDYDESYSTDQDAQDISNEQLDLVVVGDEYTQEIESSLAKANIGSEILNDKLQDMTPTKARILLPSFGKLTLGNSHDTTDNESQQTNLFKSFPNFSFTPQKIDFSAHASHEASSLPIVTTTDVDRKLNNQPIYIDKNNIPSFSFKPFLFKGTNVSVINDKLDGPQTPSPNIAADDNNLTPYLDKIFTKGPPSNKSLTREALKNINLAGLVKDNFKVLNDYFKVHKIDTETFAKSFTEIALIENNATENSLSCKLLEALLNNPSKFDENVLLTSIFSHCGLIKSEDKKVKKPNPKDQTLLLELLGLFIDKPYISQNTNMMLSMFLKSI